MVVGCFGCDGVEFGVELVGGASHLVCMYDSEADEGACRSFPGR